MQNLSIGGLIAHCVLFWGPYVVESFKQARTGTQPDRHWRAMQKYKEAPWHWYVALLVLSFVAGECFLLVVALVAALIPNRVDRGVEG